MTNYDRKTCQEIAQSKDLWAEYVGPNVSREEADTAYDERTQDERLALIHELWPDDCTCNPMGIPQWQYEQEQARLAGQKEQ